MRSQCNQMQALVAVEKDHSILMRTLLPCGDWCHTEVYCAALCMLHCMVPDDSPAELAIAFHSNIVSPVRGWQLSNSKYLVAHSNSTCLTAQHLSAKLPRTAQVSPLPKLCITASQMLMQGLKQYYT